MQALQVGAVVLQSVNASVIDETALHDFAAVLVVAVKFDKFETVFKIHIRGAYEIIK